MASAFKNLSSSDLVKLIDSPEYEKIIKEEHKQICNKKIDGSFEASEANRLMNRYSKHVCFDHSRVVLPVEKNRGNYINANYVDGFAYERKFICTQGPMEYTAYDFWRLAWMEHVQIIVMLCRTTENNIQKCYPYWSEEKQSSKVFGKFRITTTKIERFSSYVKTTLLLTDGTAASQVVAHLQFTDWPDFGVPQDAVGFLNFILEVRRSHDILKQSAQKYLGGQHWEHCSNHFILSDGRKSTL